jgi:glycosyltransferase involved in cell wall biosynthesis
MGVEKSRMAPSPTVFVVLPAFNEAPLVATVLKELLLSVPKDQIIVIDDGSVDGTGVISERMGVFTLRHLINCGQGAALVTGIQVALGLGADVIVTFDADGQHRAADIPELVAPILAGEADVVLGSRFLVHKPEGMGTTRYLVLKLGAIFTHLVSGINITDPHNGFRAFSRYAARTIQIKQDRMAHASEILHEIARHRLTYVERPVKVRYTEYSLAKGQKSTAALRIGIKFLLSRILK